MMTPGEYAKLVTIIKPHLGRFTVRGERERSARPWKVDNETQIFIFFFYVKHYPTFWLMSFMFGLCELYIASIVKRVSLCLHWIAIHRPRADGGLGSFPSMEELARLDIAESKMKPPGLESYWLNVDGSRFQIMGRPDLYNQKDKAQCIIALLGVSMAGDLMWTSDVMEHQNENTILAESGLPELLQSNKEGVIADAGINFNSEHDEAERGHIMAAWTMGPLSLHRSKTLLIEILTLLCDNPRSVDLARGRLLESVALELRHALRNTKIVSSARIVSENAIKKFKVWNYFSTRNRSYHLKDKHETTLSYNDVWKGMGFVYRFLGMERGKFCRAPDWESKAANKPPYVPLPGMRNATQWQWRVRQYDGDGGNRARIVDVEVGSALFVALWERHYPGTDWKTYEKKITNKAMFFTNNLASG